MIILSIIHRKEGIVYQRRYETMRRAQGAAIRILCDLAKLAYRYEDLSIRSPAELAEAYEMTRHNVGEDFWVVIRAESEEGKPEKLRILTTGNAGF